MLDCFRMSNKRTNRRHNVSSGKETKRKEQPDSFYGKKPLWRFNQIDFDHTKWNIEECNVIDTQLLRKLRDFESMTWNEIIRASGGRKSGNNSHFVSFNDMVKEAQKRAKELNIEEYEELFSLRLTGKMRLFGILQDGIFSIVWYDENHEISKVKKK